jgi:hypothetical protein
MLMVKVGQQQRPRSRQHHQGGANEQEPSPRGSQGYERGMKMGEKGNVIDISEGVFANLAEQGPQFWISYEQYKLARDKGAEERVVAEGTVDPAAERPRNQAEG